MVAALALAVLLLGTLAMALVLVAVVAESGWAIAGEPGAWLLMAMLLPLLGPPLLVLTIATRIVSRHRVLAADRAAALLPGSAASVAAALLAVGHAMADERGYRLRRVRPRDVFHFVPARRPRARALPWATYPSVERRIARLERLEAGAQHPGLG